MSENSVSEQLANGTSKEELRARRQAHINRVRSMPRHDWPALIKEVTGHVREFDFVTTDMIKTKFGFQTNHTYRLLKKLCALGVLEKSSGKRWSVVKSKEPKHVVVLAKPKKPKRFFLGWQDHMPAAETILARTGTISHAVLSRSLGVGSSTAAKIMCALEEKKLLGPYDPKLRNRPLLNGLRSPDQAPSKPANTLPSAKPATEDSCDFLRHLRDIIGADSRTGKRLAEVVLEITTLRSFKAKLSDL